MKRRDFLKLAGAVSVAGCRLATAARRANADSRVSSSLALVIDTGPLTPSATAPARSWER